MRKTRLRWRGGVLPGGSGWEGFYHGLTLQVRSGVAAFLARIDPESRSLVYASAGQEGYLLDHAGKVRRLKSTSLPLGIHKDELGTCRSATT